MRILLIIIALIFVVLPIANAQVGTAASAAITTAVGTAVGAEVAKGGGTLIEWIANKTIVMPIVVLNQIIGFIGAIFITLAGLLIQFGLVLNSAIMSSEVVLIGWRLVRDVTNLGFVIGIIVIAFSTMLRIENYAMKKTLAKLIAAALLVNFSLTIAGVFIDSSHIFTNFFISKSIGGGYQNGLSINGLEKFSENLAFAFSPQKLLQVNTSNPPAFTAMASTAAGLLSLVASTFFVTLFTIFAAEGMLAVAIMILYRYIVLSILLIIMPMALLLWVFPALEKHWKSWWSKFIEQILFLPISTFFIYLSILMVNVKANSPKSPTNLAFQINEVSGQAFTQFLHVMSTPFSNIGQMMVVLGLLIGGLFTAKKLGAVGADTAIATATNMRNWILNQAGRRVAGETGLKIAQRLGNRATEIREAFMKGGASKKLKGTAGERITKTPLEQKTDFLKEFGSMSLEKRIQTARLKSTMDDPAQATAMAIVLAQKDEIDSLIPKEQLEGKTEQERRIMIDNAFKPFKQAVIKSGDKSILKFMPDLAQDFGMDINLVMSQLNKPEDVDGVNYRSLENIEVVTRLNEDHINRLGAYGNNKQREAVIGSILNNIDKPDVRERAKLESFVKIMRTDLSGGWIGNPKLDELVKKIKPTLQPKLKIGTDGASAILSPSSPQYNPPPPPAGRPPRPPLPPGQHWFVPPPSSTPPNSSGKTL